MVDLATAITANRPAPKGAGANLSAKQTGIAVIRRRGGKLMAHLHGHKEPVDMTNPGVHVHLPVGAQYQDGDGSLIDVHEAFHTNPKALPPALLKMIEEAVENYMATHDLHNGGFGAKPMPPKPQPAPAQPDLTAALA